jgi:hypothetical protein
MHNAITVLYFAWFKVPGFVKVCLDTATSVIMFEGSRDPGLSFLVLVLDLRQQLRSGIYAPKSVGTGNSSLVGNWLILRP